MVALRQENRLLLHSGHLVVGKTISSINMVYDHASGTEPCVP